MGRVQVNDGQELSYKDINNLAPLHETEIYDRVLYQLLHRTYNAFFGDSLSVSRTSGTTITVKQGLGIQYDSSQISPEPTKRPLYLSSDQILTIAPPDPTNNRIDLICAKAARGILATELRRYKATTDAIPTTQTFTTQTDWAADLQIVTGTPAGSPVAPAVPAGYIQLAAITVTASTGIAASGAITDSRALFGYGPVWDAVVGTSNGCTHATLALALASVSAGARILIVSDDTLNSTLTISNNNIELVFAPGVTYTNGTAGTGITVAATGIRVKGGRFSGFTTAISISNTFNANFISECRFATCTNDVTDNNSTPNNAIFGNITE